MWDDRSKLMHVDIYIYDRYIDNKSANDSSPKTYGTKKNRLRFNGLKFPAQQKHTQSKLAVKGRVPEISGWIHHDLSVKHPYKCPIFGVKC